MIELIPLKCKSCGAPFKPTDNRCEYCGTYFIVKNDTPVDLVPSMNAMVISGTPVPTIVYTREYLEDTSTAIIEDQLRRSARRIARNIDESVRVTIV